MTSLQRLLSVASDALSPIPCDHKIAVGIPSALRQLLGVRNGFSAFQNALVVFPCNRVMDMPSIHEWNNILGWRRWYAGLIDNDAMFFAQDLFGTQFAITQAEVVRMNPETGDAHLYSRSLEGWAQRLLDNVEEDTALPLANEWAESEGTLSRSERLLPKVPFVLGGEYEITNLTPVHCEQAMEYWGLMYQTIRDIPDGQSVTLSGWVC